MFSRQESSFLETLKYYKEVLSKKGRTKNYAKILELIGRLREKYPKGSKLYEINVESDNNKAAKAINITWNKKEC